MSIYNNITILYQPIYSIKNNEIVSYEGLCRYKDIAVNKLFEIVEYYKIQDINNYIKDKIRLAQYHLKKPVHYNACYFELDNLNNFDEIDYVELSEKHFNIDKLDAIKALCYKCNVCLDDIGSGESAWQYIPELSHLYGIKLDKLFADQLNHDASDKYIVMLEYILQMCGELDIKLYIEGVETLYQLNIFKQIGFDYIQGYYLSKPKPLSELTSVI